MSASSTSRPASSAPADQRTRRPRHAAGAASCHLVSCPAGLYLKRGSAPDPFSPDASTRQWTFTPGGMGLKGTTASPGPWFLSQISGANTLGFRNVSLTLRFQ
ncbi:MAG: hypothetical protein Q8L14_40020 [Myxococcales bacterium]|nr:hypothetical protein [Myxococcales bacterium]